MYYFDKPPADEVEMMRAIVRHALWDVVADENRLIAAHKVVACAKALLARGHYDFTIEQACEEYDEQPDDPDTPIEWVKGIVGSAASHVSYCENQLMTSNAVLACVKAALVRGNYEFKVDELAKEMEARYQNNQGIGK